MCVCLVHGTFTYVYVQYLCVCMWILCMSTIQYVLIYTVVNIHLMYVDTYSMCICVHTYHVQLNCVYDWMYIKLSSSLHLQNSQYIMEAPMKF